MERRCTLEPFLIYGANGYTGELIARTAAARGERPILAGRNAAEVGALAGELGLEHRVFGLDDAAALDRGLEGVSVVLHCAGPFSRTSRPMADACLRTKKHYLDITGEIVVFEALAKRDAEAKAAGVMLLPGIGFDVVPSDCLAAHLRRRLPTATHLALGFQSTGGVSQGTASTAIENLHRGGMVRRDGALTPVPAGWKTRVIDFGRGPTKAVTIPWGDVSTAYHSTGIPNIEVYLAAPVSVRAFLRMARVLAPVLRRPGVQEALKKRVRAKSRGPSPSSRARARSYLWGEARDDRGAVVSRLQGPDGYDITIMTALAAVTHVRGGHAPAGFQTPSRAYGPDFVLQIAGTRRADE